MTAVAGQRKADVRFDAPLLTPAGAQVHLGIPRTTIMDWIKRPAADRHPVVHSVAPQVPKGPRLPLIALAEAQILRELRQAGLSMQHLREAVAALRRRTQEEYVLATNTIATDGGDLLYNVASKVAPEWVRAVDGQGAIREVIETVIKYVHYAPDGYADRLILRPYGSATVIIDPRFAFGQPVLDRSKVRVETIADLFYRGGESVESIADEYDISTNEVETVLRVIGRRAA